MHLPVSRVRTDTELKRITQLFELIGGAPHPGQLDFLRYETRYRVLLNGRRWGKTRLLAMALLLHVQEMHAVNHPNPRVRLIAPENKQIQETLTYFRDLCFKLGLPLSEDTNPRDWHLMAGRVKIEPRSGTNRKTHRGAGVTFVIIDECSEIPADLFYYAVLPSLTDYRGHALLAGTVKGRNWVIEWAESNGVEIPYGWTDQRNLVLNPTGDFLLMRAPTWENPYLPPDELERLRSRFYALRNRSEAELTELDRAFLQEYGAIILLGYENVFPVKPIEVHEWSQYDLKQMMYADWVVGLDYGFAAPSACVIAGYCPDGVFRVPIVGYQVKINDHEFVSWVKDHFKYKIGRNPFRMIIADPNFWDKTGKNNNITLANLFEGIGIPMEKGIRDREARWLHLRTMLHEQRVMIYAPRCEGLIEEFRKAKPADPYGVKRDIKKPDHALSALAHATEYCLKADPPPFGDAIPEPETIMEHEIRQFYQQITRNGHGQRVFRERRGERELTKARWS